MNAKLWVPYELRCAPELESEFQAQVATSEFGQVQTALMTTTPYSIERTPKLIRQADPEVFQLNCAVRGTGRLTQGGRRADVGVGDLVLFDTSRPCRADFAPDTAASRQLLLLRFPALCCHCLPRSCGA
ncbi:hypothetical protein ACFUTV_42810 [Streptomyces sp. NPDC057298]|uniref:AraC-like ligand-binding domain-containing protein n=1 Tax=Streptomyces sp. NPDC057298 TaxID=3346091 RepID=UPI0036428D38